MAKKVANKQRSGQYTNTVGETYRNVVAAKGAVVQSYRVRGGKTLRAGRQNRMAKFALIANRPYQLSYPYPVSKDIVSQAIRNVAENIDAYQEAYKNNPQGKMVIEYKSSRGRARSILLDTQEISNAAFKKLKTYGPK